MTTISHSNDCCPKLNNEGFIDYKYALVESYKIGLRFIIIASVIVPIPFALLCLASQTREWVLLYIFGVITTFAGMSIGLLFVADSEWDEQYVKWHENKTENRLRRIEEAIKNDNH